MPSLKQIRRRITSVKSTQQITKAMKMVAASKLRRAQERIAAFSAYAEKTTEVVHSLASQISPDDHPLLRLPEEEKKVLLLTISSDRGLCGAFNTNVYKRSAVFLREKKEAGVEVHTVTIGRKINDQLKRREIPIATHHTGIFDKLDFATASEITNAAMAQFLAGDYDAVYIVYNHFVTAMTQELRCEQLLPLAPPAEKSSAPKAGDKKEEATQLMDFIYEPDRMAILDQLLPQSVRLHVYRSLLDSVAAEHGARMAAMDSASTNAKKAIGKLTLQYNRARQAAITKELMEIVSGAEALK